MNREQFKRWSRGIALIAERCGWRRAKGEYTPCSVDTWKWYKPGEEIPEYMKVFTGHTSLADSTELDERPPDYFEDLNAMHEAEKFLTEDEFSAYCKNLHQICCPLKCSSSTCGYAISANSEKRVEAYLKAIAK